MGWPVAHSRSPRLHGYWLEKYAIDGAYLPLAVPPERIGQALAALPALGFAGCNVTVPHKEEALAAVDRVEETAERIGAVNTIVVEEDGSLTGSNTDAYGFMANLRAGVGDWRHDRPALVLGAGGAARAIIVGLLDDGVPGIRLCNRTQSRAESLADELGPGIDVVPWSERSEACAGSGLLVNTTTLGMAGKAPLEIFLTELDAEAVVSDIVYAPLETDVLRSARARHLRCVDGLGMLLHQARPGFAAWFGREPEVDGGLRDFILADLAS
jgi:shikimate dehydrogenase